MEDVRDIMASSLDNGEKWRSWADVRRRVASLNFFGIVATYQDKVCGCVLWHPVRGTARIFYTWAHEGIKGLMPNLLVCVSQHLPKPMGTVSAVINEDALDTCNDFKEAEYKSIKVLPKAFDGRDGILFCKPREDQVHAV